MGDSTATNRGGKSFDKNETWNLGQMTRATFGQENVWIVGQYTYDGKVTAAHQWGGDHQDHTLQPALEGSYEERMHVTVQRELEGSEEEGACFHFCTQPFAEPNGGGGGGGGGKKQEEDDDDDIDEFQAARQVVREAVANNEPIALALVDLCRPEIPRLQRWVGVSYRPKTERQSHYGSLSISQCYDQIIFIVRSFFSSSCTSFVYFFVFMLSLHRADMLFVFFFLSSCSALLLLLRTQRMA